jgi:hypothetical protein
MRVTGLLLTSVLLASSCAERSEDEIQAEFDAFVQKRSVCERADQCTMVAAACPLGCAVAVNTVHVAAVRDKAAELVEEYESGGRSCAYSCVAVSDVECTMGRCTLEF